MKTATPLQAKTPFEIAPQPMKGLFTARAGLAAVSRVLRSLGLPDACARKLPLKQRDRGFSPAQQLEALILLHAAGGDCAADMEQLRQDPGVTKMLGYTVPSPRCVGDFLQLFHDQELVDAARAQAESQQKLAFIPMENAALAGLAAVQGELVRAIARREAAAGETTSAATVDQDATIIESHKAQAKIAYDGTRGYQPMLAVWAETNLILADEFRDGNVPAQMGPQACAKAAFAALPQTVTELYFRGDSACHESGLVNWLRDEKRPSGPPGCIGFAISARMSTELAAALKGTPEADWKTFAKERDGTLRQWVELDFVPGEKTEKKDLQPLRYVGLRLLKPQGELFHDGHDRHYHAVLGNRWEIDGGALLDWHRAKAGTIEQVHEELKNGLGGGRMPSGDFGADAAWLRIACLAHNVLTALRRGWPDEKLKTAKAKRLRFEVLNVTGRFSRDRRKITLHLAAPVEWIKALLKLFLRFPLITRSTG